MLKIADGGLLHFFFSPSAGVTPGEKVSWWLGWLENAFDPAEGKEGLDKQKRRNTSKEGEIKLDGHVGSRFWKALRSIEPG